METLPRKVEFATRPALMRRNTSRASLRLVDGVVARLKSTAKEQRSSNNILVADIVTRQYACQQGQYTTNETMCIAEQGTLWAVWVGAVHCSYARDSTVWKTFSCQDLAGKGKTLGRQSKIRK